MKMVNLSRSIDRFLCVIENWLNKKCRSTKIAEIFVQSVIDRKSVAEEYRCPICGKKFRSPESLYRHLLANRRSRCRRCLMYLLHELAEAYIEFYSGVKKVYMRKGCRGYQIELGNDIIKSRSLAEVAKRFVKKRFGGSV